MRFLAFVLLSCVFIMCKSKEILPVKPQLNYIVILEGASTAQVLKKGLSFDLMNFKKMDTQLNQWAIDFEGDMTGSGKLKAELLNHPKVVIVFTKDEFEKMKSKSGNKSQDDSNSRKKISKQ